ncbi:FecR family protein [Poseidonocella sedimentorum]|uniref:FecR protein n=1 Tax=Poseidonocella sedimentorum TaxID=871652 RepID=A0A1I6DPE3_9RHOB|nr:FecR family protein [Poseidonocella sedimentorum]SFR07330.1 FecR protein [Poseidonocella sedimentorum]
MIAQCLTRLTRSLGLALCLASPLAAQDIGKVASQTPSLRGAPPGATARALSPGAGVVADETITTSATGRGQLLFRDETTLSIAPSTEIVLDRFVYDPARGSGAVGLTLARGALRFIGGKATRAQPAEITTPTATIGIRGSSALVFIEDGRSTAIFIAGDQLCLTPAAAPAHCTNRRGGVLDETGYRGTVSPTALARALARIDGAPVVGAAPPAGAATGTGIAGLAPPGGAPLSSKGERYDLDAFDEGILRRELEVLLPNGAGAGAMDGPEDGPSEGYTNTCTPDFVDEFFGGNLSDCLAEMGG